MDKLINGTNWISFCEPERYISELLIPGTHDTMTADCQQRYYKTQTLSLEEQLELHSDQYQPSVLQHLADSGWLGSR